MPSRTKLYFDGGYRPHADGMETAVVLRGQAYLQRDLGIGSSTDAEWLALIHAIRLVRELDLRDVVLLGDSMTVVTQANGTAKTRGSATEYLATYRALIVDGPPPRIRHIKRSQNLAGIALARLRL